MGSAVTRGHRGKVSVQTLSGWIEPRGFLRCQNMGLSWLMVLSGRVIRHGAVRWQSEPVFPKKQVSKIGLDRTFA